MTTDLFHDVEYITGWLDRSNERSQHEDSMRILKVAEELGEATRAYIGYTGQNPRKGVTHTLDDVLQELADVAITALCAIQHFTKEIVETEDIMETKAFGIRKRIETSSSAESSA